MTKEQEEAIDYLEKYIIWETLGERKLENDIKTVLNLIQEKDNRIEELEKALIDEQMKHIAEIEKLKKDKER